MKRISILILALWTGLSNFAYAQAKIECADMMASDKKVSQVHCHKGGCECTMESRSKEQSEPNSVNPNVAHLGVLYGSTDNTISIFTTNRSHNFLFKSPPEKPPLYSLFSVYRI